MQRILRHAQDRPFDASILLSIDPEPIERCSESMGRLAGACSGPLSVIIFPTNQEILAFSNDIGYNVLHLNTLEVMYGQSHFHKDP